MLKNIVFVVCLIVVSSFGTTADSALLKPGTKAPSFSLLQLGGPRVELYTLCGDTLQKPYLNKVRHTIILSFWATYCVPCQKEIPELQKFVEAHVADTVKLFCISLDKDGASAVEPCAKERNYTVPILYDQYKKAAERYGVKSLPSLVVIDPRGIIRYASTGYDEKINMRDRLEQVLKAIKSGKPVPDFKKSSGVAVPVKANK